MANRDFKRSVEALERARHFIPEGIKGMHQLTKIGDYPGYFLRSSGAKVWDTDGNELIDHVMGKGPYILGYGHPEVDQAVIEQVARGNVFPMGSPLHTQLAEKLIELIPAAEKVLFYKTGTCATAAAVRIARAYTGKDLIYSSGYHGWQDWSNHGTGVPDAVTQNFVEFNYDLDHLEENLLQSSDAAAAIILTPEPFYFTEEYYHDLQKIADRYNLLLILDEVKTGFRVDLGGFQKKYNLQPHLSTFSKAMSNGYSISAVTGRSEVLDIHQQLHTAGTFDTETISFAAAIKTLEVLERDATLDQVNETGQHLVSSINRLFKEHELDMHVVFAGGSFRFWCKDVDLETLFYQKMAMEGVLFYPYDNSFISAAHTPEIVEQTIQACNNVVEQHLHEYKGNYQAFDLDQLSGFQNKKGFLNTYPGPLGRKQLTVSRSS